MSWKTKTVKTSAYGSDNYRLAVTIKIESQSISDNSTLLSYRVYADNTGYSSTWVAYYSRSVVINGSTVYSASARINGYKNQTFKSGTIRIPHNSDGSKSIDVSIGANIYNTSGNYKSGSDTIVLPRIDRGIHSVSLAYGWSTLVGNKNITFEKYNSNATVKLSYAYWSNKDNRYTEEYLISSEYESGSNFSFPESDINTMHVDRPSGKSATVKIFLRAYVGDSLIETITRSIDLKLKVEAPTLDIAYKFTGENQSLLGDEKKGLRDVHQLGLTFDATAYNGANIKEYKIEYDETTYTTKNNTFSIVPKKSGLRGLKVTVFDSRNFSRSAILNVEVLPYEKPKIIYSAHRSENGQENPIGDVALVTGSISVFNVLDKNSAWWKDSVNNQTVNGPAISCSFGLPINEQREVIVNYGDKFTKSAVKIIIPVGYAPLVLGKESVGVNMVPPGEAKGLWIKDSLLNGESIVTYTDYSGFTGGDFEGMAEKMRQNADNMSLTFATLTSSTTAGYGILHVFANRTRAVGLIQLYTRHLRRVDYDGTKWTVTTVGG